MKNITLLILAAFFACLCQACHSNTKNNEEANDDTANVVADTAKHAAIIIDKSDIKFITDVDEACLAEIKIGALAKQKGTDKRVKNFGAMMVKDLTKGKGRLVALAKVKKITLPDSISSTDQQSINDLAKKSGRDFDHAYLNKMRDDYKRAMVLFQNTSKTAFDPDIKGFAAKNLPTLQRHMDVIEAMHDSMK